MRASSPAIKSRGLERIRGLECNSTTYCQVLKGWWGTILVLVKTVNLTMEGENLPGGGGGMYKGEMTGENLPGGKSPGVGGCPRIILPSYLPTYIHTHIHS